MKLREYQIEAKRTCPSLGSFEKDILHMFLGVNTEIGEVLDVFKKNLAYGKEIDRVNLEEEIGDICWYFANQMTFEEYDIDFEITSIMEDYSNLNQIEMCYQLFEFSRLFNVEDSSWFDLWQELYDLASALNIDLHKALERNINKLKVRFPEKFTQENALNRDLEAERKILES